MIFWDWNISIFSFRHFGDGVFFYVRFVERDFVAVDVGDGDLIFVDVDNFTRETNNALNEKFIVRCTFALNYLSTERLRKEKLKFIDEECVVIDIGWFHRDTVHATGFYNEGTKE